MSEEEIKLKSGCEMAGCSFYTHRTCNNPNEYVNADGNAVCGRREDAILVEKKVVRDLQAELRDPFPATDIQWMPQQVGAGKNGPWALVTAYVDARALQERLDKVFGVLGWTDKYDVVPGQGVLCTLRVDWNGEWVSKSNGAPETKIEGFKGGISTAFKRVCASGLGIGRYLYHLDACFTDCQWEKPKGSRSQNKADGWHEAKLENKGRELYWKTPNLPQWALPAHVPEVNREPAKSNTQQSIDSKKKPVEKKAPRPTITDEQKDILVRCMEDKDMQEEDQHALIKEVCGAESFGKIPRDLVPVLVVAVSKWKEEQDAPETQGGLNL